MGDFEKQRGGLLKDFHCLYLKCIRSSCQPLSRSLFRGRPAKLGHSLSGCISVFRKVIYCGRMKSNYVHSLPFLSAQKSPIDWKAERRFISFYWCLLTRSLCFCIIFKLCSCCLIIAKRQHCITKVIIFNKSKSLSLRSQTEAIIFCPFLLKCKLSLTSEAQNDILKKLNRFFSVYINFLKLPK